MGMYEGMKKPLLTLLVPLLILVTILATNTTEAANNHISVYIDRESQYFDQEPILENNRTLVPMRHIFESLGASILWDSKTNTVIATKNKKTIKITINSSEAIVDGKKVTLDVPAKIVNGRTLVPLRFVSQAIGGNVEWDGNAQVVYITTGQSERENILNTIFKIEMSTLHILNKQMENELFTGKKASFSQVEQKLANYYTDSYIQNVWKPFYNSFYFSEWYTHTTYLFAYLLNEPYLSETMKFYYEKEGNKKITFRFKDDPRVNDGPMGVTIQKHEYTLINDGSGWKVDRIN